METTVKLVKINEPELAEYLANPDGPCTLFVATNEVGTRSWLRSSSLPTYISCCATPRCSLLMHAPTCCCLNNNMCRRSKTA